MKKEIKEILNSHFDDKRKRELLNEYKESIALAEKVLNGEYEYCDKCKDYYLARSFFTETETVEENVCIYSSPINSGDDEYEKHSITHAYRVCPKGHRREIDRRDNGNVHG